jgi:thiol-disulfide isomerase/thioredoxin
MATYKKGYKKQTSDQLLLKLIFGIVVSVVLIVVVALLYNLVFTTRSYDDFDQVTTYATVYTQQDANKVQIPDYLVYFYNETNTTCQSIKDDVLKLASEAKKNGTIIFFVNTANTTDDDAELDDFVLGLDLSSMKIPMVVVVKDGTFYEKFINADPVISVLTDVKNSDYTPFN